MNRILATFRFFAMTYDQESQLLISNAKNRKRNIRHQSKLRTTFIDEITPRIALVVVFINKQGKCWSKMCR